MFLCVLVRGFRIGQALLLLAPFTGVQEIAGSIVGDTLAAMFNLNQWNNRVSSLALSRPQVISWLRDTIVPFLRL